MTHPCIINNFPGAKINLVDLSELTVGYPFKNFEFSGLLGNFWIRVSLQ